MTRDLIKAFMALHTFLIRASRGRLGTRLFSLTFLLLHTIGRRSGGHFVIPILYFSTDGCYFVVGSNWGSRHNAAWYYNLLDQPQTTIEIGGREIPVQASRVHGEEYDQMWKKAVRHYPGYERYRQNTQRHIPIVKLVPEERREEN